MLWMNEPRHPETSKANIPVTQSIHDLWHLRWPISAEPRCSHFGERRARGRGTPRDAGGDAISGHRHQRHPACHMSWKIRNFWKQQLTTTIYPIMNEICIYIPRTSNNHKFLPRDKSASFAKVCLVCKKVLVYVLSCFVSPSTTTHNMHNHTLSWALHTVISRVAQLDPNAWKLSGKLSAIERHIQSTPFSVLPQWPNCGSGVQLSPLSQ